MQINTENNTKTNKKKTLNSIIQQYNKKETFTIDDIFSKFRKITPIEPFKLKPYLTKTLNDEVKNNQLFKIVNGVYSRNADFYEIETDSFLNSFLGKDR
jgi:hypothetical protein